MSNTKYQEVFNKIVKLIDSLQGHEMSNEIRFEIGKVMFENSKEDNQLVKKLVPDLTKEFGKGYSKDSLYPMLYIYEHYHNKKEDFEKEKKLSLAQIKKLLPEKLPKYPNITAKSTRKKREKDFKRHELKTKIKSITLQNIKLFDDITIEFEDSVCFIGHNGSGKSAILRSLSLALSYTNDFLTIDEKNIIGYDFLKTNEFNNYGKPTNEKKGNIIVDFCINDESLSNKIEITKMSGGSYEFLMPENKIIEENNKFKFLVIGFPQNRYTKNKINFESSNEPHISDLKSIIFNEDSGINKLFAKFIVDNEKNENVKPVVNKIKEIIKTIIESEFDIAEIERDESNQETLLIKTNENPDGIDAELLSDGYKDLIGWIGYFCKKMYYAAKQKNRFENISAICLIDEIDTYLHPKWQRKILSVLINNFPNTQFIVTTHSPLILQGQKNIIELKNENNNITPVLHLDNAEFSYKTIMKEYFGIDFPFSFETEKIYNEYIVLKQKLLIDKVITKEFTKIVNLLSTKSIELEGIMRREIIQLEKLLDKNIDL